MVREDDLFALFEDLEQQAGALYDAERAPDLVDRSRAEYRQVTLAGRLMASVGREVQLDVPGPGVLAGVLERVGATWCLLRGHRQEWVVRVASVGAVHGASERSVPEVAWSPTTRLGVGSALRHLADAGERCVLHREDGTTHTGVLRRVGADFVEVLSSEPERVVLVALGGVAAIQSRP